MLILRAQKIKKLQSFVRELIHVNHAPSNRVLEISARLKQRYGYELKIFAGGMFSYRVNAAEANYTTNAMVIPKFQFVHIKMKSIDPDVVLLFGDCHPVQKLLQ